MLPLRAGVLARLGFENLRELAREETLGFREAALPERDLDEDFPLAERADINEPADLNEPALLEIRLV